jgi:hypothetical protein
MDTMTRKRKKPGSSEDRHLSHRMLRVPEDLYLQFKKLAERNDRPMSWELRRVLVELLTANGLWPPGEESQEE